jgi:hypothetical protein
VPALLAEPDARQRPDAPLLLASSRRLAADRLDEIATFVLRRPVQREVLRVLVRDGLRAEGWAWMERPEWAAKVGCCEATVSRAMGDWETVGVVARYDFRDGSTSAPTYRLLPAQLLEAVA